jgi:transposase
VAAIHEGRVIGLTACKMAVDRFVFLEFLQKALHEVKSRPLYILVDQAPLHKTEEVKVFCERKGIVLVFNAPYSSEYNAVERLWAIAKRNFRRKLLTTQLQQIKFAKAKELVEASIREVRPGPLQQHTRTCLERMRQFIN